MATHSSVLAWRIPGTGEPGGLPSMGSHRVGHDWGDLAAAANCEEFGWLNSYKNSSFLHFLPSYLVGDWEMCTLLNRMCLPDRGESLSLRRKYEQLCYSSILFNAFLNLCKEVAVLNVCILYFMIPVKDSFNTIRTGEGEGSWALGMST